MFIPSGTATKPTMLLLATTLRAGPMRRQKPLDTTPGMSKPGMSKPK